LTRIAGSPRGLIVTASHDHTIRLWDAQTGRQDRVLKHDRSVLDISLSPDGRKLASSSWDDTLRLWDVGSGKQIYQLPGHGRYGGKRPVQFTPDGNQLYSWGDDDFYLRKWDVVTGKALLEYRLQPSGVQVPGEDAKADGRRQEVFRMQLMLSLGPATFSSNAKYFLLTVGGHFHVFDAATGKELRTIPTESNHVASLAVSPDGMYLLASAWGKEVQTKLSDGKIRSVAAKDHPICLWELSTGKLVKKIMLPEAGAGPVAFSADGTLFAAGLDSPDSKVRVWNVATGEEVLTRDGVPGRMSALAFMPDGKRLVSGMQDGSALVWGLTNK
jgi:WD40 repeat protein